MYISCSFFFVKLSGEVFVPPFVDLVSNDIQENIKKLKEAGVHYPFGKFYDFFTLISKV